MSDVLKRAWALLADVTPLDVNCGQVCNARCCHADDQSSGMRLFPGEEQLVAACGYRLTLTSDGGELLECDGHCDRALRPLACRMFPLFPYVDEEGRVRAVYDPRAWRLCPLVRECAHVPLQRDFVRAVRRAGRVLMEDPRCAAYLQEQSREIDLLNGLLPLQNQRAPIARRRP